MRDYKELQEAGNRAGLEKLQANEHKDGFDDIDIEYASERILDEWIELRGILQTKGIPPITRLNLIRHEAADIRNFCDMIILKCDKEIKP